MSTVYASVFAADRRGGYKLVHVMEFLPAILVLTRDGLREIGTCDVDGGLESAVGQWISCCCNVKHETMMLESGAFREKDAPDSL